MNDSVDIPLFICNCSFACPGSSVIKYPPSEVSYSEVVAVAVLSLVAVHSLFPTDMKGKERKPLLRHEMTYQ